ncbi:MAG: high-affinity nickel-transport family protein [Gemmatimonadota bacterium]|nr:high-affinity nickel-transport family protein [Gemmatimonadota bacterium]
MSALSAALLGFLLGLKHATDADHVVAVTTIVSRERSFGRAARIGALWGLGHSVTVIAIGGALVVLRLAMPPRVGLGLEFVVALMLILLGFTNLRDERTRSTPGEDLPRGAAWRPLAVGIIHGLAGSAAVALLVLAAIPETAWALAYLVVFCAGTVGGMVVVTWLLAAPAVYAARHVVRFQRGIRLAAGMLSLVFGIVLAREVIVNGGLFRATPNWTPR